jgi:hypothetical protein
MGSDYRDERPLPQPDTECNRNAFSLSVDTYPNTYPDADPHAHPNTYSDTDTNAHT